MQSWDTDPDDEEGLDDDDEEGLDDDDEDFLDYDAEEPTEIVVDFINQLLENIEVIEESGEVRIHLPDGHLETIRSPEDLETILYEEGFHPTVIDNAVESDEVKAAFKDSESIRQGALFRIDESLIVHPVMVELSSVNAALIEYLGKHPEFLYILDSRRFEELVAELFRDFGYEVLLTPRTRDGGIDLRAVRKDSVGCLMYLVECKRYSRSRPVGVDIVRGLYGATQAERASCGILATTSRFTKDAQEFASKCRYQVSLRDYTDIISWINQYKSLSRRKASL